MKIISGGVTAPLGFKAHGISCGIKRSGKLDLALIACDIPATAAGVFTRNSIQAAPVLVTQKKIRRKKAQAIVINSGNANCFTGDFGLLYAQKTARRIAQLLKISADNVLVASTGIIGKMLPYQKIEGAADQLVSGLSRQNGRKAAQAILTTDTKVKEVAVELRLGSRKVRIGACAKGSGMIQPNMATMLAFITSDAAIDAARLKTALTRAVEPSFNSMTVDGCMSTNDMVLILSNGLAQNTTIKDQGRDFEVFLDALKYVSLDLAKKIVWDGEGATKFIEITVAGAPSYVQAHQVALAVANSNLVKTAAYGSNPNWGRIAAAVGSVGLPVTERRLKIRFSSFAHKHIKIWIDLCLGRDTAVVYTADLSEEYVRINGRYN